MTLKPDKRAKLRFKVAPDHLVRLGYVPDPVRCKIIDATAPALTRILGQSGRRLAEVGAHFYFTRRLAEKLIKTKIARRVRC